MTEKMNGEFNLKRQMTSILKENSFKKQGKYYASTLSGVIMVFMHLYKSRYADEFFLTLNARHSQIPLDEYFDFHLQANVNDLVVVTPSFASVLNLENSLNPSQRQAALEDAMERLLPIVNNWLDEDWLLKKGCEDFDPVIRSTAIFRESARKLIISRST